MSLTTRKTAPSPRRLQHQQHSPFALATRKLDAGTLTYGEARDALFRAGRARKTSECAAFVRALCLKRPARGGGGASFRVSEHLASFALNAYAREGDTAAARHLLRDLETTGGVAPTALSFCILVKGCGRAAERCADKRGWAREVDRVLEDCKKANARADLVLLNSAVDAYARCGDPARACALLGSMEADWGVKPDARGYNAALKALCHGHPRAALGLARVMRREGIEPTAVTNATLAHALGHARPDAALRILPSLVPAVTAAEREADPEAARERDLAATAAYTAVLGEFANRGEAKRAYDVARAMRSRGVRRNAITYAELFRALAARPPSVGREDVVAALWRKMRGEGVRPTVVTYNVAIGALCAAPLGGGPVPEAAVKRALGLAAELREGAGWTAITLNLLLAALFGPAPPPTTYDQPGPKRVARHEAAERLLKRAERDPAAFARPDAATYTITLRARARRGDLAGAIAAFDTLRRSDAKADVVACNAMLEAFLRNGALPDALRLLGNMRTGTCPALGSDLPAPDARSFGMVLEALARDGDAQRALDVFEAARAARRVDARCARAALMACTHLKAPARGLFDITPNAREDVTAARSVLAGARELLPPEEVLRLRDFAQDLLSQCDSETWKGPASAEARPPRWRAAETAADRIFYERGWNSVDSGFKLF